MCNKEFKPKINFRQHVFEVHPEVQNSKETTEPSCAFCQQIFEDAVLRRKHYNNLECIMFIVCCSCGERFEEHTTYVDHIYQHHLPSQHTGQDEYGYELFDQDGNSSSSHLRNPQNCPVCNKQYNNVSLQCLTFNSIDKNSHNVVKNQEKRYFSKKKLALVRKTSKLCFLAFVPHQKHRAGTVYDERGFLRMYCMKNNSASTVVVIMQLNSNRHRHISFKYIFYRCLLECAKTRCKRFG